MVSLPRALSKLGFCSRTEATALIDQGRVMVDDRPVHSPSQRVDLRRARIAVDGRSVIAERPLYLMLNKPRGLVTTRRDPQERGTVYDCLPPDLPFLSPVGRLDKASEGLLLMTNDTGWANYLLDCCATIRVRIADNQDENGGGVSVGTRGEAPRSDRHTAAGVFSSGRALW